MEGYQSGIDLLTHLLAREQRSHFPKFLQASGTVCLVLTDWMCLFQLMALLSHCGATDWSGCLKPGRETCQTNTTSAQQEGECKDGSELKCWVWWPIFVITYITQQFILSATQHRSWKVWADIMGAHSLTYSTLCCHGPGNRSNTLMQECLVILSVQVKVGQSYDCICMMWYPLEGKNHHL